MGWCATAAIAQDDASEGEPSATEEEPSLPAELLDPNIGLEELTLRLVPLTREELAALAAEWLAIVKSKTEEVVEAQIEIANSEGDGQEQARELLTRLVEERGALLDSYSTIVSSWEKKGGVPEEIEAFRAYRNSIIVEETRTADFETPDGSGARLAGRGRRRGRLGYRHRNHRGLHSGPHSIRPNCPPHRAPMDSPHPQSVQAASGLSGDRGLLARPGVRADGRSVGAGCRHLASVRPDRRRVHHYGFRFPGHARESRQRPDDHDQPAVRRR